MFYSKSTAGFYDSDIHGDNIPDDAVEISQEDYEALLTAQETGKIITADDSGNPISQDPPAPTNDVLYARLRNKRDALLTACDWTQLADAPETNKSAWVDYRNALRHLPENTPNPANVTWPNPPV